MAESLRSGKSRDEKMASATQAINSGEAFKEAAPPPPPPAPEPYAPDDGRSLFGRPSTVQPKSQEKEKPAVSEQETKKTPSEDKAPTESKQAQIRKIKANGKEHEVDFSNQEELEKHVKMSLGARKAFAERDKLAKEKEQLITEQKNLAKYKEAFDVLEQIKDNPEELFSRITGGKTLDEYFKKKMEREQFLAKATPAEKEAFLTKEEAAKIRQEWESEKKERAEAQKRTAELEKEVETKQVTAQLMSEFSKVRFFDKMEDKAIAQELDELLWTKAVYNLNKMAVANKLEELPQSLVKKEFERVAKLLTNVNQEKVDASIKAADTKRSESAKKDAQLASTKNYGSQIQEEDLRQFAARPTKLWGTLFPKR